MMTFLCWTGSKAHYASPFGGEKWSPKRVKQCLRIGHRRHTALCGVWVALDLDNRCDAELCKTCEHIAARGKVVSKP